MLKYMNKMLKYKSKIFEIQIKIQVHKLKRCTAQVSVIMSILKWFKMQVEINLSRLYKPKLKFRFSLKVDLIKKDSKMFLC